MKLMLLPQTTGVIIDMDASTISWSVLWVAELSVT